MGLIVYKKIRSVFFGLSLLTSCAVLFAQNGNEARNPQKIVSKKTASSEEKKDRIKKHSEAISKLITHFAARLIAKTISAEDVLRTVVDLKKKNKIGPKNVDEIVQKLKLVELLCEEFAVKMQNGMSKKEVLEEIFKLSNEGILPTKYVRALLTGLNLYFHKIRLEFENKRLTREQYNQIVIQEIMFRLKNKSITQDQAMILLKKWRATSFSEKLLNGGAKVLHVSRKYVLPFILLGGGIYGFSKAVAGSAGAIGSAITKGSGILGRLDGLYNAGFFPLALSLQSMLYGQTPPSLLAPGAPDSRMMMARALFEINRGINGGVDFDQDGHVVYNPGSNDLLVQMINQNKVNKKSKKWSRFFASKKKSTKKRVKKNENMPKAKRK